MAVRRDLHIGDDLGPDLWPGDPDRVDPRAYAVTPVHAWLAGRIAAGRYADLVAAGVLVPLPGRLTATPTAALRTLLLPPGAGPGRGGSPPGWSRYLKLSLDIQVTSTRRTISVASTHNGPVLSRLLDRLLAEGPGGDRVLLMAETAGAATRLPGGRERELVRDRPLRAHRPARPGRGAVPGSALYASARPPGAAGGGRPRRPVRRHPPPGRAAGGRAGFLDEYAALLLPPVLALATRHGIGLEAHLQNCVPTFVAGVPHRLALRDLAGLRLHPPRLARPPDLWPGSVIVADDVDTMLAKVVYTALQAHLGELVDPPGALARPGRAGGLGPRAGAGRRASTTTCAATRPRPDGPRTTTPS